MVVGEQKVDTVGSIRQWYCTERSDYLIVDELTVSEQAINMNQFLHLQCVCYDLIHAEASASTVMIMTTTTSVE